MSSASLASPDSGFMDWGPKKEKKKEKCYSMFKFQIESEKKISETSGGDGYITL